MFVKKSYVILHIFLNSKFDTSFRAVKSEKSFFEMAWLLRLIDQRRRELPRIINRNLRDHLNPFEVSEER